MNISAKCVNQYFCVGATFEMRTVQYGICLLIDKLEIHDRFFYIKTICAGRESKMIERQKER